MNMLVVLLKGCAYGKAGDRIRLPFKQAEKLCLKGTARIVDSWRDDISRKETKWQPK